MFRGRRREEEERPKQDHSWRCSTCALNYPVQVTCKVCGGSTALISNQSPTEDLAYHIALMNGERPPEEDRATGWRIEQLVKAGAPIPLAERIADDRNIDLHKAVGIVAAAGPELAEAILF